MNDEERSKQSDAPKDGIPTPLLNDLHQANEQFHRARKHVEEANEALINPFEERDRASQDMRDAERAVEAVEEKIEKELKNK